MTGCSSSNWFKRSLKGTVERGARQRDTNWPQQQEASRMSTDRGVSSIGECKNQCRFFATRVDGADMI
jgi:hypothetical protein